LGKAIPFTGKNAYWDACDQYYYTHKMGQEGALYTCDNGRPTVVEYKAGESCMTPKFGCKCALSGKYFSTGTNKSDFKNKNNINIQDIQSLAEYN
jgi:DNA replicative helicase MCM subunit Mcm2 (Cdc46/Mcm family)